MELALKILVFAPLIAAIIVGLNTTKLSVKASQLITCYGICTSAIISWFAFYYVIGSSDPQSYTLELLTWISLGDLHTSWTLKVDALTTIMLVLVTNVSALVHIYSIGYMSHDKHPQRFMAYLSLFSFFMLMLVTADNFIQLFLGWEGVGLASYLLIGFWYKKESACNAAIKAFVVNRVGDFGLALGIFAIYQVFGTLQYDEVFAQIGSYTSSTFNLFGSEYDAYTTICLLLFIGAMGKSAQLFLHTWLPDAMEGPTPVSALIHAATMVTAGVFLVARCSPLFEQAPLAKDVVTYVGASTAIFAASIALVQNDIKRVIAYSTCSQLGYMFFACGVSAYSAGVFHLFTHGFFKALLFLGAGSVIHAMSNEQDMRNMGGLWRKIPFTFAMMMIGTLAITGFPYLFSGFYSKEAILGAAKAAGVGEGNGGLSSASYAYWLGTAAAVLTAFYSWRLIFMTFFGTSRASKEVQSHIHESPKVMTVPLLLLSFGAIGVGAALALGMGIVHDISAYNDFWNGAILANTVNGIDVLSRGHEFATELTISTMIIFLIGLVGAYVCYIKKPEIPVKTAKTFKPVYNFLVNKWYFDELYDLIFVRPAKALGSLLWKKGDIGIIDRFGPNGFAKAAMQLGKGVSKIQSGYVYHYAFSMLLGVVLIASWFLYVLIQDGVQ